MYEEGHKRLSSGWVSFILKLLILALFVFILCWIFTRNAGNKDNTNTNTTTSSEFSSNISAMKDAANSYFNEDNLPVVTGDSKKVTLKELIDAKLVADFTDNGSKCDVNNSYAKATKTGNDDYQLKINLECDGKKDYIVANITKKCTTDECKTTEIESTDTEKATVADTTSTKNTSSSNTSKTSTSSNTTKTSTSSSSNNSSYTNSSSSSKTTTIKTTTTVKVTLSCANCNSNQTYYLLAKYSDWSDGYSNATNAENKEFTVNTYDYCKKQTKTYYSTSWANANNSSSKYSYEYQILDINPSEVVDNTLAITNRSYFTSSIDYRNYNIDRSNSVMYMTGNTGVKNSETSNIATFISSSLKNNNFTFSVSDPYIKGNVYRTTIGINYNNADGVVKYNSANQNINNPIYFVPLKFDVTYANKNNCVTDLEGNAARYAGYVMVNKNTTTTWKHRTVEYKWSTTTNEDGWTYTGQSKVM